MSKKFNENFEPDFVQCLDFVYLKCMQISAYLIK